MLKTQGMTLCAIVVLCMATVTWPRTLDLAWIRQIGTNNFDYSNSVAVDSSGNVYISGETYGNFDGETNAGGSDTGDAFLTKYNSDGIKQWTELIGTSGFDLSRTVAVDNSGNIFISGLSYGDLDGGTNAGGADAFLTKYDADGTKQWTELIGTSGFDLSHSVAVDTLGDVYISGSTEGNLDGETNSGNYDAFLTKYNSDGIKQWTELIGTSSEDRSESVAVDAAGNIFISGQTYGDLDGGTNVGGADAFLTKYDADGTKQWTELIGTSGSDVSESTTADASGNVYISGSTQGAFDGYNNVGGADVFLIKYEIPEPATLTLLAVFTLLTCGRRRVSLPRR